MPQMSPFDPPGRSPRALRRDINNLSLNSPTMPIFPPFIIHRFLQAFPSAINATPGLPASRQAM